MGAYDRGFKVREPLFLMQEVTGFDVDGLRGKSGPGTVLGRRLFCRGKQPEAEQLGGRCLEGCSSSRVA